MNDQQIKRIPSLDGFRAVAILMVIFYHSSIGGVIPHLDALGKLGDFGVFGVRVFFVISGFLITTLLMAEQHKTHVISLKAFYVRRLFRITPAYYAFLLITAALTRAGVLTNGTNPLSSLPYALLYLSDYKRMHWDWGQSWSLAVEEQFYLIWPAIIAMAGARAGLKTALGVVLVVPIFRYAAHVGAWPTMEISAFECVADAMAIGCCLALCRDTLWANSVYAKVVASPIMLHLIALAFICAQHFLRGSQIWYFCKITATCVLIALYLDRYMRFPNMLGGKALNSRPMIAIGVVSYSLYLWQQVFVAPPAKYPLNIFLMIAAAIGSYFLVEKPFLRLRKRLMEPDGQAAKWLQLKAPGNA